jgi:hypothetical protein
LNTISSLNAIHLNSLSFSVLLEFLNIFCLPFRVSWTPKKEIYFCLHFSPRVGVRRKQAPKKNVYLTILSQFLFLRSLTNRQHNGSFRKVENPSFVHDSTHNLSWGICLPEFLRQFFSLLLGVEGKSEVFLSRRLKVQTNSKHSHNNNE